MVARLPELVGLSADLIDPKAKKKKNQPDEPTPKVLIGEGLSPYISLHLPASPHASLYLPLSPTISFYLPPSRPRWCPSARASQSSRPRASANLSPNPSLSPNPNPSAHPHPHPHPNSSQAKGERVTRVCLDTLLEQATHP